MFLGRCVLGLDSLRSILRFAPQVEKANDYNFKVQEGPKYLFNNIKDAVILFEPRTSATRLAHFRGMIEILMV